MKSMKFARIGLAMMALGMVSGAAVAQDSFSDSHIEAAKAVAIETKVLEPFDAILFVMSEQTLSAFTQNDPTRAEEIAQVVQNVALSLAPRRAELNQEIYKIWAAAFSEEELVQLAEFYRTPLGSKLRDSIAEITGRSVNASREWQDRLSVDMVALVQEELTKGDTEAPKE
ncbi:DUF2059 domain-containing protein [Roseibium sp.]|uniref:DUF2059 domain-containing protein n=1 Tax=Roseibium sp. TaxID=1936156 RepID=UPI003B52B592